MRSLVLSVILFVCTVCFGQSECHIEHFGQLNDKASRLTRILQDRQGYIWLATSNGLIRFDGYDFITFKPSLDIPELSSDNIESAYMTVTGDVWCKSGKRALLFNCHTCTFTDALSKIEKTQKRKFEVHKVRTTPDGNAWITTEDGMLLRANAGGTEVVEGARVDDDFEIGMDYRGRVWLLTGDNATIFGKQTSRIRHSFKHLVTTDGVTWLVDSKGRVYRLEQNGKLTELKDSRISGKVDELNAEGALLIVDIAEKIYLINSRTGQVIDIGITGKRKFSYHDNDGNLWMQTSEGTLMRVIPQTHITQKIIGLAGLVKKMTQDRQGNLWALTDEGQLYFIPTGGLMAHLYPTVGDDLSKGKMFLTDRQGGIWLWNATGLSRLWISQRNYQMFDLGFEAKVRALYVDKKKNRYWISTQEENTITLYDSNNRRLGYLGMDGRLHDSYTTLQFPVYCIKEDVKGNIWLGTKHGGLYRLRENAEGGFAVDHFMPDFKDPYSLNSDGIYCMANDKKGRLWIGTYQGGLNCVVDPAAQKPRFLNCGNELKGYSDSYDKFVICLIVTKDNRIVAGLRNGLVTADANQTNLKRMKFNIFVRKDSNGEGLSANNITSLAEMRDGSIFIGTENGGLNLVKAESLRSDNPTFVHLNQQNNSVSDIVRSVFIAGSQVWIAGMSQLQKLTPQDKGDRMLCNIYLHNEDIAFTEALPIKLPDGRWMFGTSTGCIVTDLKWTEDASASVPIMFTSFNIGNTTTEYAFVNGDTLMLQPTQRHLTISFSSLNYDNSSEVSYAYKMGDGNWVFLGKSHSVTFDKLGHGTFKLTVCSTDGNGMWRKNYKTLVIIAKPTLWETPWGVIIILLIVGLLGYAGMKLWAYIKSMRSRTAEASNNLRKFVESQSQKEEIRKEHHELIKKTNSKALDDDFMKALREYIDTNMSNSELNLDSMADAMSMSVSALRRRTKAILGVSPNDLLRQSRIAKACELLKDTKTPVANVAYTCGFSDPKYFSRIFKTVMGMTPSEYQAETMGQKKDELQKPAPNE